MRRNWCYAKSAINVWTGHIQMKIALLLVKTRMESITAFWKAGHDLEKNAELIYCRRGAPHRKWKEVFCTAMCNNNCISKFCFKRFCSLHLKLKSWWRSSKQGSENNSNILFWLSVILLYSRIAFLCKYLVVLALLNSFFTKILQGRLSLFANCYFFLLPTHVLVFSTIL